MVRDTALDSATQNAGRQEAVSVVGVRTTVAVSRIAATHGTDGVVQGEHRNAGTGSVPAPLGVGSGDSRDEDLGVHPPG